VAAYPKDAVASQALEDSKLVLQLGLISLLVVLALVYGVLRRQVSHPLHSFIRSVHSVADGDANIYLDRQRSEELNQLADSFLAMQKVVRDNMQQLSQEVSEKNLAQQELVQAHEALKEANDQLELRVLHRTASLHAANDELSNALHKLQATQQQLVEAEKMSSLGGLVAGVAHEINTPIGICLTAASSLQDDLTVLSRRYKSGEMTEQGFLDFLQLADESLQMLVSNNQRAAQLIQSFKQVAVDQSSEDKRHFLLKAYIQEVLFSLQPKLKKTPHKVKVSCDEGIELESYPGAVAQILTNLIMNSLIHGFEHKPQGNIIIEAHQEDDQVCILYRDDGCGMNQEAVKRVFEPFFTTKRGGGGSGLGSHLVYNLVTQKLNGSIHCSSELSQGVVFIIRIPLHV
jgi:C4-dicarboxylate-specific signal transduction histidine kinase